MAFSELSGWHIASLAAALPMLACNTSDGEDGFRITSIAYDSQDRLVLTFSEPIVDPSNVDPADFRLSLGRTSQLIVPGQQPMQMTAYDGLGYGGFLDSLALGSEPNQLVLTPAYTIDFSYYCEQIDYYLDYYQSTSTCISRSTTPRAQSGTSTWACSSTTPRGGIPIESEQGETIADVAPDFVLTDAGYTYDETRYGFINYLRIPCP